ncbi:MAG: enhancer of mRNA decapping [Candelina submexicana]|nr:MAG: enhancer of mRNA decapping [Candelina submexicana]
MAADFIGVTVLVTLRSPPDAQLQGLVADVVGQQLILRDVIFTSTGNRLPEYYVDGSQIADLEVAPLSLVSTSAPTNTSSIAAPPSQGPSPYEQIYVNPAQQQQSYFPTLQPLNSFPPQGKGGHPLRPSATQSPQPFTDPAILSFGKKPSAPNNDRPLRPASQAPPPIPQELLSEAVKASPSRATPTLPLQPVLVTKTRPRTSSLVSGSTKVRRDATTATLTAPFESLSIKSSTDGMDETDEPTGAAGSVRQGSVPPLRRQAQPLETPVKMDYTGKRSRRGGKRKPQKDSLARTVLTEVDPVEELDSSPMTVRKKDKSTRSKGWRQTSLIKESRSLDDKTSRVNGKVPAHEASSELRRGNRKQRGLIGDHNDDWATEEATDIRGMGEFDFQGNLSKFDKRTVFDQIRNEDTTADESRLVSFNRAPAPRAGTAGGKNLHHTENVLDRPKTNGIWNSEAGDSDDDDPSEGAFASGRSSRRAMSRSSTRQPPSRKGSSIAGPVNASLVSSNHLLNSLNKVHYSSSHATGSPKPNKHSPSASSLPTSTKSSLRVVSTDRSCPTVGPLQMLEIEHIATSELGLTEDMMTENAARGIAQVSISVLSPGGKRLAKNNHNPLPVIVVLAGNNKSGARAVAAGRHLRNRGVRVLICVLGLEHEDELLESVRRQLAIFRKIGGRVLRWEELSASLMTIDAPPELVIDALLGMHISFEDLRSADQGVAYEMIAWANRSKANVLAVDMPTGVDASSGQITVVDGEPLKLRANFVVSMGAAKTGILNALDTGDIQARQIFVADIGISNTAWKKYGTRRRHGVEFGSDWVVELKYRGAVE